MWIDLKSAGKLLKMDKQFLFTGKYSGSRRGREVANSPKKVVIVCMCVVCHT